MKIIKCDEMGYALEPGYDEWHKFWDGQTLCVFETKEEWTKYVLSIYPDFFKEITD